MEIVATDTTETATGISINPAELRRAMRCAQEYQQRLSWRMNPLSWFDPHLQGVSWAAWRAFIAALFALALDSDQEALYRKCTGRTSLPAKPSREAWLIVGRRGGKSIISALIACFLATVRDYAKYLAAGEVATVMVIAADRKQARSVMRYISGFMRASERLSVMVMSETKEAICLSNRVVIEVHTASFRSTRGYTLAAVICDEIAFWRSEDSASPDVEVLNALKPAMGTIPESIMLGISSPYSRKGAMWEAYRKHFGKDGDSVLVWQADTHTMNPELDSEIIDQAYDEDSAAAGAEYGAQFRSDVDGFIPPEVVEAAVVKGRFELEPVSDLRYFGFIDPSGGSADSMTMAIAHIRDSKGVLDLVREKKPPFSPENVSKEFADELKRFRITQAQSDYYAGEWPREQFSKHGISVKTSERSRSEIYLEILPALNSGKLELLDNPRLVSQLCSLERRTARSGKDSVDHPPGGHDDVINAAAGALVQCVSITKTTSIIDAYRHMNAARQEAQQQHASA